MEEKQKQLERLKKEIEEDTSLPLCGESNLVIGEGDANAKIMFIGEAPGFHENEQRRPFVGQAGKLLESLLKQINWPRESVYITNIVKRRPPQNRDPELAEIAAYKPYLKKQIQIIYPNVIATLGRFSMNYFLPDAKISRDHGKQFRIKDIIIYPLYHPAAALRSTSVLKELELDFKKLPEVVRSVNQPNHDILEKKHEEVSKQASLF